METAEEFIAKKQKKVNEGKAIVNAKDIGREGKFIFKIVKATFMIQHNLPHKVFVVEKLELTQLEGKHAYKEYTKMKKGDIEYRIGYYIIGKNGKMKDKWTWGQYCPLIPEQDFDKLIQKAKKEGTLPPTT